MECFQLGPTVTHQSVGRKGLRDGSHRAATGRRTPREAGRGPGILKQRAPAAPRGARSRLPSALPERGRRRSPESGSQRRVVPAPSAGSGRQARACGCCGCCGSRGSAPPRARPPRPEAPPPAAAPAPKRRPPPASPWPHPGLRLCGLRLPPSPELRRPPVAWPPPPPPPAETRPRAQPPWSAPEPVSPGGPAGRKGRAERDVTLSGLYSLPQSGTERSPEERSAPGAGSVLLFWCTHWEATGEPTPSFTFVFPVLIL